MARAAARPAFKTLTFVNVSFVGAPGAGDRQWVLIDAGVPGTAGTIEKAAAERFGEHARPAAIVLTHGHVDHRGALPALAAKWDAPIYAHPPETHGPPRYVTPDCVSAKRSVQTLAALEPELVLTGHGHPLRGPEMRAARHLLARDFDRIAMPTHGRYVNEPARADESGPTYVPPKE